jgi:hypothetical protein
VAHRAGRAGLDVLVQDPRALPAEAAYWPATGKVSDAQMAEVRQRVWELLPPQRPRRTDRKRTALGVEVVPQWETAGAVPQAHDACDTGGLPGDLPRLSERCGTPWGSAIACSRQSNWRGQWRRVDQGAAAFRGQPPARFRPVTVTCRHGEEKQSGVFTQVVRGKK